ncbi:MAG: enoyl-CoA hydratase-related protein [Myxococcales bacterium]|nr:enoyl-CoA hydratase-related protein [Polyangiaceae bacterium]MDW8250130.1 enoyl-CoA hydratase-related protein [Myxococcales bacterium]
MDYQYLQIERDGPITTITLHRPDKLNALDARLIAELTHAIHHLRFDRQDGPRVVILTGAGKAFVAGGDIATMAAMNSIEASRFAEAGHRLCYQIEMSPFPVIAAVNGFALGGGCELMLACDLAYAADSAKLGQPEVNLGVIPGFGGTQRLARRVGLAKARELIYTGEPLSAEEALRIGLINGVFPAHELLSKVRDIALKIASKGPLAIAAAKRVLLRGTDIELATANELEIQTFGVLFGSTDQKEGMAAFLEKRKATFEGK